MSARDDEIIAAHYQKISSAGGKARRDALTPAERSAIARKAGRAYAKKFKGKKRGPYKTNGG